MSRIASCGSGRFQDFSALPDIQTRVRVRSRFPSDSRTVDATTIRACREPSRMMRVGVEWTIVPVEDSRGVSFFRTGRRRRPACAAQRACPRPCSFMRLRIPWLARAPAYVPDRTRPSAPGGPRSSRLRLWAGGARPMCRNARGSVRDRAAVRPRSPRTGPRPVRRPWRPARTRPGPSEGRDQSGGAFRTHRNRRICVPNPLHRPQTGSASPSPTVGVDPLREQFATLVILVRNAALSATGDAFGPCNLPCSRKIVGNALGTRQAMSVCVDPARKVGAV